MTVPHGGGLKQKRVANEEKEPSKGRRGGWEKEGARDVWTDHAHDAEMPINMMMAGWRPARAAAAAGYCLQRCVQQEQDRQQAARR